MSVFMFIMGTLFPGVLAHEKFWEILSVRCPLLEISQEILKRGASFLDLHLSGTFLKALRCSNPGLSTKINVLSQKNPLSSSDLATLLSFLLHWYNGKKRVNLEVRLIGSWIMTVAYRRQGLFFKSWRASLWGGWSLKAATRIEWNHLSQVPVFW